MHVEYLQALYKDVLVEKRMNRWTEEYKQLTTGILSDIIIEYSHMFLYLYLVLVNLVDLHNKHIWEIYVNVL